MMTIVYALWHEYVPSPGVDAERLIGVYSTKAKAESARLLVCNKPGFVDYSEHFEIYDILVDRDNWTEGFFTWTAGEA